MATRSRRMRRICAVSQVATSMGESPARTRTWPRVTGFKPLAARSRVDLPEPDSPMRTEISPRSTQKDAGYADDDSKFVLDIAPGAACVEGRQGLADGPAAV